MSTKIIALVDALGNLLRFALYPGQCHELKSAQGLLEGVSPGALLADKAYDADWFRAELDRRAIQAVIPPKSNRLEPAPFDAEMYKWRHLVENYFQKLKEFKEFKEFKRIAMRACKTDISYAAMIQLVAVVINTR